MIKVMRHDGDDEQRDDGTRLGDSNGDVLEEGIEVDCYAEGLCCRAPDGKITHMHLWVGGGDYVVGQECVVYVRGGYDNDAITLASHPWLKFKRNENIMLTPPPGTKKRLLSCDERLAEALLEFLKA